MKHPASWRIYQSRNITRFTVLNDRETIELGFSSRHISSSQLYKELLRQKPKNQLVTPRQVHSNRSIRITRRHTHPLERRHSASRIYISRCDALASTLEGVALTVRTADCLPIFFIAPQKPAVIGLLHAGWRGSHEGVAVQWVRRYRDRLGVKPKELQVVLGPAIRRCCYEVGPEFRNLFSSKLFRVSRRQKIYLDLIKVNRQQLLSEGVLSRNIYDLGICTSCEHKLYFSYRKEGKNSDRIVSWIVKRRRQLPAFNGKR